VDAEASAIGQTEVHPLYLAFFEKFNQGLFFEAHEVLEELWLPERGRPLDRFYKGLIQLAGAFVHVQKSRLQPALALFRLAEENLGPFAPVFKRLDVAALLARIERWRACLQQEPPAALLSAPKPQLNLLATGMRGRLRK
jgi:predicted metal-dependent hydrolase